MDWLTLWLKKIILLVLLAAFLDLILPNTTLQKYVKMVMGLIILITILTPAFSLLQLSPDELAIRLTRYKENLNLSSPQSDYRALADRLLKQQNEQAEEYVAKQVESQIREQVRSEYGVEAGEVVVSIDSQPGKQPQIESVTLTIANDPRQKADRQIRPIEPVIIKVGDDRMEETAAVPAASRQDEHPLYRNIARSIAQAWELSAERVKVASETDKAEVRR
ncbi:stage III sporulation protein AF [Brevibacillus massiliensis]|jgi:stage III sporulation protein AF|uniref:stage III sporulation protein AF n=1 Tax=Brevibacillus massiliensis TaxID=1118054 RepID=UPI0002FCACF1|nr:stage III sporulation protein AF [Brevibacillus massiliensis]